MSASLKFGSAKTLIWNAFERTKSPEQCIDDLNSEEEIGENSEFEGATVVFADTLEHNQKTIEPFFTLEHHEDLDVYYLSLLYFNQPKGTIGDDSQKIFWPKQTLKDAQNVFTEKLLVLIWDMMNSKKFVGKLEKMMITNILKKRENWKEMWRYILCF